MKTTRISMLRAVAAGALTMGDVADATGISYGNVTRRVEELESIGWVEVELAGDRRTKVLTVSTAGMAALASNPQGCSR